MIPPHLAIIPWGISLEEPPTNPSNCVCVCVAELISNNRTSSGKRWLMPIPTMAPASLSSCPESNGEQKESKFANFHANINTNSHHNIPPMEANACTVSQATGPSPEGTLEALGGHSMTNSVASSSSISLNINEPTWYDIVPNVGMSKQQIGSGLHNSSIVPSLFLPSIFVPAPSAEHETHFHHDNEDSPSVPGPSY